MTATLPASADLLEGHRAEIRQVLEDYAGVLIPTELLNGCIAEYTAACNLASPSDLVALLRKSPSACDSLLDQLLPRDTSFFRYPAAFTALQKQVIPEIIERKGASASRSLRLWSAGCSTGEEAYSMAMSVCEALDGNNGGWKIHLVASDISAEALKFAERGVYDASSMRAVPPHLVSAYFSRLAPQHMVKTRLRNLVSFTRMNLAQPDFLGHFDCIFCVGVLPGLSPSHRSALVQRLHMFLEPGGYLFLGQNEKMPAADIRFLSEDHFSCTLFRRPMAAAAHGR